MRPENAPIRDRNSPAGGLTYAKREGARAPLPLGLNGKILTREGSSLQPQTAYLKPSTSCMSYRPDVFSARKRAALRAPMANVARLDALWVISTRSPMPANMTV